MDQSESVDQVHGASTNAHMMKASDMSINFKVTLTLSARWASEELEPGANNILVSGWRG
jgi:hypothetical protein